VPTWSPAPTAAEIAGPLIAENHMHLLGIPILYVFRSPAAVSKGRAVAAKARKVSGLSAFMTALAAGTAEPDVDHSFFVMELAGDIWHALDDTARRALVDHELCHFAVDEDEDTGDLILRIRGHDIEEFLEVVNRHGLWSDDVRDFAAACATIGGGR